jgi:hypothetical protein
MVYEENAAIGPSRRNLLKKGLLTGFGLAVGIASPIFTGIARATSLQNGWYYCTACKELFHGTGRVPRQVASAGR